LNGRGSVAGDDRRPVSKGHLNPATSAPVARYAPSSDLAALVRHHWVPECALPEGRVVTARVLGYPALNLVVEPSGVLISGPTTAASERVLRGRGWAVGVLLQPAGTPALGYDASALLDSATPVEALRLRDDVAAAMEADAAARERHGAAVAVVEAWLRERLGPVSEQGLLANRAAEIVESDAGLVRVAELAARLRVTERTLQRAVRRCTGMSPHDLVRRRRLQDAADRLRQGTGADLSRLAAEVGYSDHAHLTREFRASINETPSDFRGGS
jgi:AraC-like DNA-binding protein